MPSKKVIPVSMVEPENLPYSRIVEYGDLIFVTGIVSSNYITGKPTYGDINSETVNALENLGRVLEEAGSSLDNILKTTVFLSNKSDFHAMNDKYRQFFQKDPPARSTIVVNLVGDYKVEIEAIAGKIDMPS